MTYKKVFNPEAVDVKTGYKGQYYELAAGETKPFAADVAERFVEVYPFLKMSDYSEPEAKKEVKKEEAAEEVVVVPAVGKITKKADKK